MDGLSSAKHSGIRSLFNQHWIKPEKLPVSLGNLYNNLFNHRNRGDYADFVSFDSVDVQKWLDESVVLVNTLSQIIEERIRQSEES